MHAHNYIGVHVCARACVCVYGIDRPFCTQLHTFWPSNQWMKINALTISLWNWRVLAFIDFIFVERFRASSVLWIENLKTYFKSGNNFLPLGLFFSRYCYFQKVTFEISNNSAPTLILGYLSSVTAPTQMWNLDKINSTQNLHRSSYIKKIIIKSDSSVFEDDC